MKHQEFVKHLNAIGFAPCGSNGCLAHIPCEWLTLENFKAAAERHETWLKQQGVDVDKMLKPGGAKTKAGVCCGPLMVPMPAVEPICCPSIG